MGYTDYADRIAFLYEIPTVYDGWSIAVLTDHTAINRWAEDDGAARIGFEHRFAATQAVIRDPDFTGFVAEYFDEVPPDLADQTPGQWTDPARKEGTCASGTLRTPPPEGSEGQRREGARRGVGHPG